MFFPEKQTQEADLFWYVSIGGFFLMPKSLNDFDWFKIGLASKAKESWSEVVEELKTIWIPKCSTNWFTNTNRLQR